jgi:hypothetical protein
MKVFTVSILYSAQSGEALRRSEIKAAPSLREQFASPSPDA